MKVRDLILRLVINTNLDDDVEVQMIVNKNSDHSLYLRGVSNVVRLDDDPYIKPVALIECENATSSEE